VLTEYRVRGDSLSMEPRVLVPNGEAVHAKLSRELTDVPVDVLNHGLANIYRIAGRKCLTSGRIDEAWFWMIKAKETYPSLLFVDRKSCVTFILIGMSRMLPKSMHGLPYACLNIAYRWLGHTAV
jgi:hypothetical protein